MAGGETNLNLPDLIGGSDNMTFGELLAGVWQAGIPTSLSACELLSGMTCERRFIIAASVTPAGGPQVLGVFDVHNGLFASLVNAPAVGLRPLALLASLGSCAVPTALCLGLPALAIDGPPELPVLPNPAGLQAAIQALLAGLQSIPDQITAPPAPPIPEAPVGGSSVARPRQLRRCWEVCPLSSLPTGSVSQKRPRRNLNDEIPHP